MGHQIFPKEVQSIVRRLDIDGDNKITFSEFYEALQLISRQNPDSNKTNAKYINFKDFHIEVKFYKLYSSNFIQLFIQVRRPLLLQTGAGKRT